MSLSAPCGGEDTPTLHATVFRQTGGFEVRTACGGFSLANGRLLKRFRSFVIDKLYGRRGGPDQMGR